MARYKYSENSKEVTDIYFDTETHGEFMGMEQGGDMKKVTTARIKEKLLGEIVLGVDWQQEVLTMTSTPPVSPTEGDRYIVGASATGDWTGYDDYIAEYASGAWVFLAPQSRMGVFSYNDMYFLIYLDGEWQLLATLDEITELRDEVQGYRDEILNNPGFQAVSADLLGDDNIGAVATSLAIITAVHNNATNINTVATNNSNVTTVATSISAVNAVATDLGLGASSLIKIVADNIAYVTSVANNITNVNTVAGLSTEITALGARTTEIDALYAQLSTIAEKENLANKKSTLVENSEIYYPTQKAVNLGLNRTMSEIMGFAPRNLMDVFGTLTVPATMKALRTYLTDSGGCDFSLLRPGDYIDLDSFTVNNWYNGAAYDSDSGAWDTTVTVTKNLSYQNTRVEIVGFSDYRYVGNTAYPSAPHVVFQFKNIPLTAPMHKLNVSPFHQTSQNYKGSDLVTIGLANFYAGLADNFGIGTANETIPYSVDRMLGTVNNYEWCGPEKLFLPTGMNIFGHPGFAQEHHGVGTQSQFPLYALNPNKKRKGYNGSSRETWWLAEPSAGSASNFTYMYVHGDLRGDYSSYRSLGVVPAFLI